MPSSQPDPGGDDEVTRLLAALAEADERLPPVLVAAQAAVYAAEYAIMCERYDADPGYRAHIDQVIAEAEDW